MCLFQRLRREVLTFVSSVLYRGAGNGLNGREEMRFLADLALPKFVEYLIQIGGNIDQKDIGFEFHQYGLSLRLLGFIR